MNTPMTCIRLSDFSVAERFPDASVLCLGNFDGIHLAHRALIEETRRLRDRTAPDAVLGAFFFRIPSSEYLSPIPIPWLMSAEDKLRKFRELGLDYAYVAEFDRIRELSPRDFAINVLQDLCHVRAVACGYDHRFGRHGAGTPELLAEHLSLPVAVLPKQTLDGAVVSSTRIRHLLLEGEPALAARLLGTPYSLTSKILHGKAYGRTRGIPTVNQDFPEHRLIPRHGVYLSRCEADGRSFYGLSNVGVHPTVDAVANVNCETYLLDVSEDLYGKEITVSFLHFLRDEKKFDTEAALYEQIDRDIQQARSIIANQK